MMQSVRKGLTTLTKVSRQGWTGPQTQRLASLVKGQGCSQLAVMPIRPFGFLHTNYLYPKMGAITPARIFARGAHNENTKGDEELLGFLSEEIATEKKLQRASNLPTTLEGFTVKMEKAEITLTRKGGNEEVTITANVNHSVDSEYQGDPNAKQGSQEGDEMRSKPNFEVDIKRGDAVINFSCSFIEATPEGENPEEFNDVFAIDEVCMYEREADEIEYSVSGDILDGYLYDLFMNMLEERGVTNEFVEKFSDLCTDYEHKLYVDLLGKLQAFLEKK